MPHFDDSRPCPSADPGVPETTEFAWDEVCRRLDGEPTGDASEKALLAFCRLFHHLQPRRAGRLNRADVRTVGLRLIALIWVLNPANLPGSPTLAQLAHDCGVSRVWLCRLTAQMSRLARWRNRAQTRASNWIPPQPDEMGVPDEV
jgi:hypothetical protein